MEMDLETIYLIVKIGAVAISGIVLYIFRRDIIKVVTDIAVGGDTKEYVGKDLNEIKQRTESRIDEVLK